jgi:hypothetical protein
MHITDLKTLMTALCTATNLPLYFSITMLNHLMHLPLTYVKLSRHIVLEIRNHEEYRCLEIKFSIYRSIGQLETSLIHIKMKFMDIPVAFLHAILSAQRAYLSSLPQQHLFCPGIFLIILIKFLLLVLPNCCPVDND